jgi:hypothetical protein
VGTARRRADLTVTGDAPMRCAALLGGLAGDVLLNKILAR